MEFNSSEYSYADVSVVMLGRPLGGLRGIKYKKSQEKEVLYAAGTEPRAILRGNKAYEGEVTVLQSELEAMLRAAGKGRDITDLRGLDIVVVYAPENGLPLVTDIIKNAEFKDFEKGMKQGDKFAEVALPFVALGIQYGN